MDKLAHSLEMTSAAYRQTSSHRAPLLYMLIISKLLIMSTPIPTQALYRPGIAHLWQRIESSIIPLPDSSGKQLQLWNQPPISGFRAILLVLVGVVARLPFSFVWASLLRSFSRHAGFRKWMMGGAAVGMVVGSAFAMGSSKSWWTVLWNVRVFAHLGFGLGAWLSETSFARRWNVSLVAGSTGGNEDTTVKTSLGVAPNAAAWIRVIDLISIILYLAGFSTQYWAKVVVPYIVYRPQVHRPTVLGFVSLTMGLLAGPGLYLVAVPVYFWRAGRHARQVAMGVLVGVASLSLLWMLDDGTTWQMGMIDGALAFFAGNLAIVVVTLVYAYRWLVVSTGGVVLSEQCQWLASQVAHPRLR